MHSSILIALLVVGISSWTYGDGDIFGVEVDPQKLFTLDKDEFDAEIDAKTKLLADIDTFEKSVPIDGRIWITDFKQLVTAERKMIETLQVPLSHLNTDNLENINDDDLRKQISGDIYGKLQKGLQDYLKMLKTFDFSGTVWEGRSFLGNKFGEFLGKVSEKPENLKVSSLKKAFKTALTEVTKIKKAINGIVSSFKKSLEPQKKKSEAVMTEIRNLNLMAVQNSDKKVSRSVSSLTGKLKKLKSAIENVNNIPPIFQCFMGKRAWLDQIRVQLNNLDSIHRTLNVDLSKLN